MTPKNCKLAPLPKPTFTKKEAAALFHNIDFIIRENCDSFNYNIFVAETFDERKAAINNCIETLNMKKQALDSLLSEFSVDDIAEGFNK